MRVAIWVVTVAIILGLNLVLPSWNQKELQLQHEGPRSRADVLLDVFGEARTVMARMLWFKMDLMHEQLDAHGIPHTQQKELIPYLRLITVLDHHIDDAYDIIANDLYEGDNKKEEAHKILDEGLSYNPKSAVLLLRKAMFLNTEKRWNQLLATANEGLLASPNSIDQRNFASLAFHAEKNLGHKDRAEHYLRLIFSLEPGSPRATQLWLQLNGKLPPQEIQYPGT